MPLKAKQICAQPGCGLLTDATKYCAQHAAVATTQTRRPSRHERGYSSHYQTKFRPWFMRRHPLCESVYGCDRPAEEIHHVTKLCDGGLACSESNCQALCRRHHAALAGKGGRG
jgi:hypothetical protein